MIRGAKIFPCEPLVHLVETDDGPALRWDTHARPALTPRQAVTALTLFALTGVLGAWAGWLLGHRGLALAFSGEAALAVALFVHYAQHACDREVVTLSGARLAVERGSGARTRCEAFDADWVRVECDEATRGFVRLSHREATVTVGRHLTPLGRWLLAQEIRRALVHSRASPRW